jgi:hypothetical protein
VTARAVERWGLNGLWQVLQILREMLQKEAARVQHEIVGYAVLIQNARRSMRTISKSLSFLKNDRDDTPRISA